MNRRSILLILFLILLLLSCNLVTGGISRETPEADLPGGEAHFSEITFCEGVSDDGEPVRLLTRYRCICPRSSY